MGETEVVSTTAEASTSQSSTSTSRQSTPPTSINSDTAADRSSKKKRKRNEEASNEDSKRRKEYKGKTASSKKRTRDEAVSDQTCDLDPEKVRKTWERIDRDVKIQIKRDEKAGRYIQLPSEKTATIPDPENPGKKLSYKGARIRRQKSLRTATKELKKKMVVDAMMEGELPNPKGYTWQEALQNFDKDIKALKKAGAPKRGTVRETKTNSKEEKPPKTPSRATDDSKAAVAAKVAKLTALEKTQYEERAKAKNQTLEQYVLRRIEKKSEKKQGADSSSISATETPLPAVVDVQNDKNLVATTISKAEMSKKVASKKKVIRTVKVRTEVAVTA
jgi:nucleolar protein TMA23